MGILSDAFPHLYDQYEYDLGQSGQQNSNGETKISVTFVLCLLQSSYHPETSALLLFTVLIKEPRNRMESEAGINGQEIASY